MSDNRFGWISIMGMIGAMFIWGSSLVALKLAFRGYDPMVVILGRMLVASICFFPFLIRFRRVSFRWSDLKYMLLMGICEPGLYFLFTSKMTTETAKSRARPISQ